MVFNTAWLTEWLTIICFFFFFVLFCRCCCCLIKYSILNSIECECNWICPIKCQSVWNVWYGCQSNYIHNRKQQNKKKQSMKNIKRLIFNSSSCKYMRKSTYCTINTIFFCSICSVDFHFKKKEVMYVCMVCVCVVKENMTIFHVYLIRHS